LQSNTVRIGKTEWRIALRGGVLENREGAVHRPKSRIRGKVWSGIARRWQLGLNCRPRQRWSFLRTAFR